MTTIKLVLGAVMLAALAAMGLMNRPRAESAAPSQPQPGQRKTMNVSLEWKMQLTEGGTRLQVEYSALNRSQERLFLCDQLVVQESDGSRLLEQASIVVNGQNPGEVVFVRGRLGDDPPSAYTYNPGARAFDPGQRLTGQIELELPLKAWHNFGYVDPLKGTPKTARLEVSIVSGESTWEQVKLKNGQTLIRPQPPTHLENISSDIKPIPER
jgi:hypothetical protein